MSHSTVSQSYSKVDYEALQDVDADADPRSSTSSGSPILPKPEVDQFDEDEPLHQGKAFDNEGLTTFYKPIEGYEGNHRYDPKYRWSRVDEQKVVLKVSLRVATRNFSPALELMVNAGSD
jgi:hypothetical protein